MERRTILKALAGLFLLPFAKLASVPTRPLLRSAGVIPWCPDAPPIDFLPTFNPERYSDSLLPTPAPKYRDLWGMPDNGEFRYALVWEGKTRELRTIGVATVEGELPYTIPHLPGVWRPSKFEDLRQGDLCCLFEPDGARANSWFYRVTEEAKPGDPDVGIVIDRVGIIA